MIGCSLGNIQDAKITRSLSGFTFAELAVPMDRYQGAPTFTLSTDNGDFEFSAVGCEVYPWGDHTLACKMTGLLKSCEQYLKSVPCSFECSKASDGLAALGIKGGPSDEINLLNLSLTRGQLAILLANVSAKPAFVNFDSKEAVYFEDLYKQQALKLTDAFRLTASRPAYAGGLYYDAQNTGLIDDGYQTVLPFDGTVNTDEVLIRNVLANYNALAELFSQLQMFTSGKDIPLGASVVSNLTSTKAVVVAKEELWSVQTVTYVYYAV